ncbi:MAG: PstS family phosphate ABC transporter substrate-binding protein [Phycisphaeraceae bacterium]|nr:MAG: PstS family phosphate ABC transporter substrate-binding protein [Phycisphaeraceae bacterium]
MLGVFGLCGVAVASGPEDKAPAKKTSAVAIDSKLPVYQPVSGVSGTYKSIGSDTMNNVMAHWNELFKQFYPGTNGEVEGKGSATAPAALKDGQAHFGPMSREMKPSEIAEIEKALNFKPTALNTGIDALAVYVHKDCPLNEITLDQVQRVFSVAGPVMTWGDLGVTTPDFKDKPISLYGRNSASGTYGYFKEHALGKKDFKDSVKEQPGSSSVVQGVASDKYAMGYSGLGYKTADVKALRVAAGSTKEYFDASAENCYEGTYPLGRFLYVYIAKDPRRDLDPLRAEFIRLIFSRQGQESVAKDGYIPVTADIAREELIKVGLKPNF